MALKIQKRKLTDKEVLLLSKEIKKAVNITIFPDKRWMGFETVYVASKDKNLVGVCAVERLQKWIKIGPLIIKEEFRGKGYGKRLFSYLIKDLHGSSLFVGSSNPIVWGMVKKLGFTRVAKIN